MAHGLTLNHLGRLWSIATCSISIATFRQVNHSLAMSQNLRRRNDTVFTVSKLVARTGSARNSTRRIGSDVQVLELAPAALSGRPGRELGGDPSVPLAL